MIEHEIELTQEITRLARVFLQAGTSRRALERDLSSSKLKLTNDEYLTTINLYFFLTSKMWEAQRKVVKNYRKLNEYSGNNVYESALKLAESRFDDIEDEFHTTLVQQKLRLN